MMVLFIAIFAGISVAILIDFSLSSLNKLQLEKRLSDRFNNIKIVQKKGLIDILLFIAEKIGQYLKRIKIEQFKHLISFLEQNFAILGKPYILISPYAFVSLELMAAIFSMFILAVLFNVSNIVHLIVFAVLGFFLPLLYIRDKVKVKHKAIFRQLPDVLDMLTLMVEAGLDFNNALNRITELEKGELIGELFIAQQETKLGLSRIDSFNNMARRLNFQPINNVVNSINTSIKTGGSLAPTIRALSDQFRTERAQSAEKTANEAPVKLLIPLAMFIFPTIFIILFGPILLSFIGIK